MSEIMTGALYGFGAVLGLFVGGVVFRSVGRALNGGRRKAAVRAAAAVAAKTVPDLTAMSPDELARDVSHRAAELDLTMRYALLKGVKIDVDLVDRSDPAYPSGRTQVRVRAVGPDGKVRQWPP